MSRVEAAVAAVAQQQKSDASAYVDKQKAGLQRVTDTLSAFAEQQHEEATKHDKEHEAAVM